MGLTDESYEELPAAKPVQPGQDDLGYLHRTSQQHSVQTAGSPFTYGLTSNRRKPAGLKLPSIGLRLDQKSVDTLQDSVDNLAFALPGSLLGGMVYTQMSSLESSGFQIGRLFSRDRMEVSNQ